MSPAPYVLCLSCALAASAAPPELEDLPAIKQRGVLRVVVGTDGTPEVATLDPDRAPGMEREMIEGFAAWQHLQVEYVPVPTTAARIPALLAGRGDVIVGNVAITEERRRQVAFTEEVFPNRSVVVTWWPRPPVQALDQLRRERVGAMKGSAWVTRALSVGVPQANLDDSYASPDDVLAALRAGKIGAVVIPIDRALLERRSHPALQLGMFLPPSPGRAWAVRKGLPLLRRALDDYIVNLRQTPSWNRLVVKYYGDLALDVIKKSRDP